MKILRAIFPFYFWIFLVTGCITLLIGDEFGKLGYMSLNLVATLLFIKVGVVIHEIGHLLFGKLAGGNPKRIVLGKSHEVKRFQVFNVKIILNKDFNGGFAFVNFPVGKKSKINKFILTSGGFFTNLIVAYLVYAVFGFNAAYLSGKHGLDFYSAFILANTLLAIISLIPYYVEYLGVKVATDGLTLLKLLFSKKNESNIDYNDFFEAQDRFEDKDFDEAINLYKKYLELEETKLLASYNVGLMHLKKGEPDEALRWIEPCLDIVDKEKNKMMYAHINNGLAWLKLVADDHEDIDLLSKTAYSIKPDFSYFAGTRGSVLIELGKVEQGIKILEPLIDFKFPNNQTISAAIYLYYGHMLQAKSDKAKKYFNFIVENVEVLDLDEKMLWNRVQEKVKLLNN
ncbi:site-2 protease family protein [Winogradskyella sp.]|uniref:site-2 protease family protein n=1 Tax=Winogradskyella sp. TaxID=1883156 RepID=UPI0026138569|nr:site-2 protease family protein [Winogradskyella sp.]